MTILSVIIPTYNRCEKLKLTLERCIEYSFGLPVQIVVVNDGSTDQTSEFLAGFKNLHQNVIVCASENRGPGNARNIGANAASGYLLLFMGDDTIPTSHECFAAHLRFHEQFKEPSLGVLGKVVLRKRADLPFSFVTSLIQGIGAQQFGYAHMSPYAQYDWRFFYTANVSVKRSCVRNWLTDGFSGDFSSASFEDMEFAYRLTQELGSLRLLYAPTSVVEHDHYYNVETFIARQERAGKMARLFVQKHSSVAASIGLSQIERIFAAPRAVEEGQERKVKLRLEMIEGIFASAKLLEQELYLGSEAWHIQFLNAVFELAFYCGAINGYPRWPANLDAAYRFALKAFELRMVQISETELLHVVSPIVTARASSNRTGHSNLEKQQLEFWTRWKRALRLST